MSMKDHIRDKSSGRGYEEADIDFGKILITGIGLLVLMVGGLLYSGMVEGIFSETSAQPGAPREVLIEGGTRRPPPEPRVEADPRSNLVALLAREDSTLFNYRWVSRDSGIVQVPIERAMELVVMNGLLESR
jgi:hypothetical protein